MPHLVSHRPVRILHRYILTQVLLASLMATGGFLFVMVAGNLFKGPLADVLGGRIPWHIFVEFTLLLIPGLMPYVLPLGILTGVLLVLGRMSAQHEITAMKSAGLSLWRISAPIVVVGLLGSVAAVFINFEYATWANARGRALISESPSTLIVEKRLINERYFSAYVDSVDNGKLEGVWVWQKDRAGNRTAFIRARSGEMVGLDDAADTGSIVLRLRDVTREEYAGAGRTPADAELRVNSFDELNLSLPLDRIMSVEKSSKKLRYHNFAELMALREKGWKTGPQSTPKQRYADRITVQLQMQSHLAGAFGILSLTMLAIPLGIRVSRSETFVNFGVALALAMTYYIVAVFVSWIKNPNLRPDIIVWLPNIIIQIIAIRLMIKAART